MINFNVNDMRDGAKLMMPSSADIDSCFNFYYDETNNIRKFYLKCNDFNHSFDSNFVLGGVVFEGEQPNVEDLYRRLNLQKSIKEVKLKHIAKGDFLDCLKSQKLSVFLEYLLGSGLYVHYLTVNYLYYSIVDIVDSAIINSDISIKLGLEFALFLKNDLYDLCKLENKSVVKLFNIYKYPNIDKINVINFIDNLISLFDRYISTNRFHIGLTSLKQILRESKKKKSLPFIMDEDDYILLKDFSNFYMRPLCIFKYSNHIFDNEGSIKSIFDTINFVNDDSHTINFKFEDSVDNLFIQISDIIIGLVGKLSNLINTLSEVDISYIYINLDKIQKKNLGLYFDLIDKSHNRNAIFFNNVTSVGDMNKIRLLYEVRRKYC